MGVGKDVGDVGCQDNVVPPIFYMVTIGCTFNLGKWG